MVEKITSFKAANGKTFETEYEAWKEDLATWLKNHGADNDAIARKIVEAIDQGQPGTLFDLAEIVTSMREAAPPTAGV